MEFEYYLFDADNTLLDFSASERDAFKNLMSKYGYSHDEEMKKKYDTINHGLWKQFEHGEITKDEVVFTRFGRLFEQEGIIHDGVEFEKEYQTALSVGHDVIDGAYEVLEELRRRGKKIYIVTNGVSTTQHKRLHESHIEEMVDGVFVSEEVGYQKPDKEFFNHVFSHIEYINREKTLIIGDSLTSDILGGNKAGIKTCWFNPFSQENDTVAKVDYEIKKLSELLEI